MNKEKNKTILKKTYLCLLCQEKTNHKTSKCPNLICKQCKKLGHTKQDCTNEVNVDNDNDKPVNHKFREEEVNVKTENLDIDDSWGPPELPEQNLGNFQPEYEAIKHLNR